MELSNVISEGRRLSMSHDHPEHRQALHNYAKSLHQLPPEHLHQVATHLGAEYHPLETVHAIGRAIHSRAKSNEPPTESTTMPGKIAAPSPTPQPAGETSLPGPQFSMPSDDERARIMANHARLLTHESATSHQHTSDILGDVSGAKFMRQRRKPISRAKKEKPTQPLLTGEDDTPYVQSFPPPEAPFHERLAWTTGLDLMKQKQMPVMGHLLTYLWGRNYKTSDMQGESHQDLFKRHKASGDKNAMEKAGKDFHASALNDLAAGHLSPEHSRIDEDVGTGMRRFRLGPRELQILGGILQKRYAANPQLSSLRIDKAVYDEAVQKYGELRKLLTPNTTRREKTRKQRAGKKQTDINAH